MGDDDNWLIKGIMLNAKFPQCVRSGYCCKKALCAFGEWNEDQSQCKFLEGDEPGGYRCGIYDDIKDLPGSRDINPAFGAGCSSGMNDDRLDILKRRVADG